MLPPTYSPLLNDFYQLTMAYGYWQLNMHEQPATFHLLFRRNPFGGDYAINCGLASVIEFLNAWHFPTDQINYLASLKNSQGAPMFPPAFLDYLSQLRFSCDIDAIPEGTLVFPHTPLLRIQGPILQCQLIESPLLNLVNFQTLIATKASRVCRAAAGDEVIEFGMRRAQGPDGALSASRAAYIGGCNATSNSLAGYLYDIPLRGTHAHSWVTAFPTEKQAFAAYASVLPQNAVLLVDTYNTIHGVKAAIEEGKKLRQQGADLLAIRLDSGDLAELSIMARKLLDEAGFEQTSILASNSLDEYVITSLKQQGAKIDAWGVGTNLTTAYDQPALDGVYKLSSLQDNNGVWQYKLKLSEQAIKVSNPGRHQVRRYYLNNKMLTDVIYDLDLTIDDHPHSNLLSHPDTEMAISHYDRAEDLLKPVFRNGKQVNTLHSIHELRATAIDNYQMFCANHPQNYLYPVGLEKNLHNLKQQLIQKFRNSIE